MAKLSTSQRKKLPKSDFAIPSKAPGPGSYPVNDKVHARVAKSYAARYASPAQRATIDAKADAILKGRKGGSK